MARRSGLSLIELMTVVSAIAVLAAALFPVFSMVRHRAKTAATVYRMEAVLSAIVAGTTGSGAADRIASLQAGAGLEGVQRFAFSATNGEPQPERGTWIDASAPHLFAFPWNQPDFTGNATEAQARLVDGRRVSTATLADLAVERSAALMQQAGVLPASDAERAYREDRRGGRPWNDAWGRPLVIAYGLFQPTDAETLTKALAQYGHGRAVYLSCAAIGPTWPAEPASWEDMPRAVWDGANEVCGAWTAASFVDPPWTGIKAGRARLQGQDVRAFLSAPVEVR